MNAIVRRQVIEKLFANVDDLPTLPSVFYMIEETLQDPNSRAQDVAKIIENDQSLTVKILKIVNSAFYGFPRRISRISNAVVILGFKEIRNLALSISLIEVFSKNKDSSTGLDHEGFWRRTLLTAIAAGILVRKAPDPKNVVPEIAFVGGLLQDIGLLILDQFAHSHFSKACEHCATNKTSLIESERAIFGFDHQEVGEFVTEKWSLPIPLVTMVAYHHAPSARKFHEDEYAHVVVIHLAHFIVQTMFESLEMDPKVSNVETSAWDFMGLSYGQIEEIAQETQDVYDDIAHILLPK